MTPNASRRFGRRTLAALALAGGIAVASVLSSNRSSNAQSAPPEPASRPSAQVTPDAQLLLNQMTEAYQKLNTFQTAGTVSISLDAGGQKKAEQSEIMGAFQSPDQFRHDLKGQDTIVSNGTKLFAYLVDKNNYLQFDAPKTRADGVPAQIGEVLMDQDPSLLLAIVPNAADALSNGATTISKSADVTLDGKSYPALNIVTADQDTQVVIDPSTGLLRQMKHDLSRSMKERNIPNVKEANVVVDYTQLSPNVVLAMAKFATPTTQAAVTATGFDWTPPADAKPMAAAPASENASAATDLQSKPAPTFSLKDLDGKPFSLADTHGKVTILDFWATWCPPCRAGLPILDKIMKDRPNDVKIYAVNLQEDAAAITPFKQQTSLSLPILLDSDGKVAELYKAEGIPETVVIGKDGVIRKVIVGIDPDEANVLNAEIDAANKAN